jgi:hypothetical protein
MGNLKEKVLGLVDLGTSQAFNLINQMNDTIKSIDWDSHFDSLNEMKDAFLEKGNSLLNDFNELMKQVKNNISDFEVTVPFDEASGEKFHHKIEDGKLIVSVSFKDDKVERSNQTTVLIPQNCDIEKLTTKYNSLNKTMTVAIPKVITETKEETHNGYKVRKSVTPRKGDDEATEHATSKLLKKFKENSSRAASSPKRAPNGRFMKRKPEGE